MSNEPLTLFLDMMTAEKGASLNTVEAYGNDLSQFMQSQNIKAHQIGEENISDYIQYLARQGYSPKSQARKLSAIKEFCRFLFSEKIISGNPAALLITPKQQKPLPKFLTPGQIKALTEQARNHKDFSMRRIGVMVQLMFATGLRVSEIVSLPANAVNYDKMEITIRGKGSKERIVPISEEAKQALFSYLEEKNAGRCQNQNPRFMFPSHISSSGFINRSTFFKKLKQLAAECGISPSLISPHTLRHSFATNLINHQADLRSVQKMLGHENISTTEIYTHITSEKLIETVFQKHPLQKFKG